MKEECNDLKKLELICLMYREERCESVEIIKRELANEAKYLCELEILKYDNKDLYFMITNKGKTYARKIKFLGMEILGLLERKEE
tara:strand:+ start:27004 stop:27258 length:255 start_codon:yes stop_codon:yes gene_type:complete